VVVGHDEQSPVAPHAAVDAQTGVAPASC